MPKSKGIARCRSQSVLSAARHGCPPARRAAALTRPWHEPCRRSAAIGRVSASLSPERGLTPVMSKVPEAARPCLSFAQVILAARICGNESRAAFSWPFSFGD
jgi:hypothetical protein